MARRIPYPVIDMKKTGENIKKIREEQGVSVSELQCFLGLANPQAIYQWQKGISIPSVDHLCALSHLFNISMNDILVLEDMTDCSPSVLQSAAQRIPFVIQTVILLAAA